MKVKTSGHGLNLRQSFIDNANKRLQKFDRFFNEEADAAVNVDLEKDRYTVEITVKSRGFFYRTERTSTDLDSAFRESVDLMMRQIVKNKSKLGNRVKVKEVELAGEELDLEPASDDEQEYRIAREKRFVIEPMSEQEAILQMNMLGHTFFMFRNADTNELNIVYRRHDDSFLNLMPTKVETETQLLRMLGNSPLQVEVEFVQTATHISKNTSAAHMSAFYKTIDEIRDQNFDGMVITGAPVEHLRFEEVEYWNELCDIMEWTKTHVFSTFHICWGAQAALYYHYGIGKHPLPEKLFGVFPHHSEVRNSKLFRGMDDVFMAPHSRHTTVLREEIESCPELTIEASSPQAGVYAVTAMEGRQIFVFGHSEYDRGTLEKEYLRDKNAGLPIRPPVNSS